VRHDDDGEYADWAAELVLRPLDGLLAPIGVPPRGEGLLASRADVEGPSVAPFRRAGSFVYGRNNLRFCLTECRFCDLCRILAEMSRTGSKEKIKDARQALYQEHILDAA